MVRKIPGKFRVALGAERGQRGGYEYQGKVITGRTEEE